MKRLFAAVLSAVLILSLSACADPAENSSQTSSSSTAEQSSEPEVSGQPEEEKNEAAEDTGSGANSASREEVTAPDQPENPASQAGRCPARTQRLSPSPVNRQSSRARQTVQPAIRERAQEMEITIRKKYIQGFPRTYSRATNRRTMLQTGHRNG